MDSQSGSETAKPSASEQQGPFPLLRLSNHGFKGDPEYRPSSRAIALPNRRAKTITASEVLTAFKLPMFATRQRHRVQFTSRLSCRSSVSRITFSAAAINMLAVDNLSASPGPSAEVTHYG